MTAEQKLALITNNIDSINQAGYKAGQNKWLKEFWGVLQDNGNRTSYAYTFGHPYSWNRNNFKPQYDLKLTGAANMFSTWKADKENRINLVEILKENGVIMDTSNCSNFSSMFNSAIGIDHIGVIDLRKGTNFENIFFYSDIKTIDKLIFNEETNARLVFQYSNELENVKIEGVIGNSFSLKNCSKLTVDSLKDIIQHLKNFSTTNQEEKPVITLRTAQLNKLANSAPPEGNDWKDYIEDHLGWTVSEV